MYEHQVIAREILARCLATEGTDKQRQGQSKQILQEISEYAALLEWTIPGLQDLVRHPHARLAADEIDELCVQFERVLAIMVAERDLVRAQEQLGAERSEAAEQAWQRLERQRKQLRERADEARFRAGNRQIQGVYRLVCERAAANAEPYVPVSIREPLQIDLQEQAALRAAEQALAAAGAK
jgi:hypothetical protein